MSIFEGVLEECQCLSLFSIEEHGPGHAIYFGRCKHKHGYNIAFVTEPDMKFLNNLILFANSHLQNK